MKVKIYLGLENLLHITSVSSSTCAKMPFWCIHICWMLVFRKYDLCPSSKGVDVCPICVVKAKKHLE